MATTGECFVLQNYEASLDGSAITAVPYVIGYERKSALSLSGRIAGGPAGASGWNSLQNPWTVSPKGIVMLDDVISAMDNDGCAKHGVFHVTTSGTTAVNIDLTNLVTNATSQSGDATFATICKLVAFNLSGLDGVAAANMSLAQGGSNPAPIGLGSTQVLYASSPWCWFNKGGATISGSAKILTVTPTAGGNFTLVVGGA
jgi:hypothetical protein